MSSFIYKKNFIISDKQARDLKITIEAPIVCFYQDMKKRVYLTASYLKMHNKCYEDLFNCTLTSTHWIIEMFLPFPWENNYKFVRKSKGIYQLMCKETEKKEYIAYVEPQPKTIPTTRCGKTKELQNMCKPKSAPYGENPDLFDTLQ